MASDVKKSDYVVFWGTTLVYVFFALIVISAYTPLHIFRSRYFSKYILTYLYQARWNVYTKKVDDPLFHLYAVDAGNTARLWDLRPFVSDYWFGLKRDYKTIAQEVLTITNDTAEIKKMRTYAITVPAGGDVTKSLRPDTMNYNIVNNPNNILLQGKYLIVSEEPMNWDKARAKEKYAKTFIVLPVNLAGK